MCARVGHRHVAAHAVRGRLLYRDWEEGLQLWRFVTTRVPVAACCFMPDHLHVLASAGCAPALRYAMSAHARWLNHRRQLTGSLWRPLSDTGEIGGLQKIRRQIRYIHLNPCRAGLVADPLAWPLSTHRDLVGLTLRPALPAHRDPVAFHRYVSSDPSVDVQGTELPFASSDPVAASDVVLAVSALSRRTVEALTRRSPERTLLIRACRSMCTEPSRQLAPLLKVSRGTVLRSEPLDFTTERLVRRVLFDDRFGCMRASDGLPRPWRRGTGLVAPAGSAP